MRTPPRRKHRQRVVDQLSFVLGRRTVAERAVTALREVRALKAGSELECQPTFHARSVLILRCWAGNQYSGPPQQLTFRTLPERSAVAMMVFPLKLPGRFVAQG